MSHGQARPLPRALAVAVLPLVSPRLRCIPQLSQRPSPGESRLLTPQLISLGLLAAPTLVDDGVRQSVARSLELGGQRGAGGRCGWGGGVTAVPLSPQAPEGCDPADSHRPGAELLLALRLVLLAPGKPPRFSLSSQPRTFFIRFNAPFRPQLFADQRFHVPIESCEKRGRTRERSSHKSSAGLGPSLWSCERAARTMRQIKGVPVLFVTVANRPCCCLGVFFGHSPAGTEAGNCWTLQLRFCPDSSYS